MILTRPSWIWRAQLGYCELIYNLYQNTSVLIQLRKSTNCLTNEFHVGKLLRPNFYLIIVDDSENTCQDPKVTKTALALLVVIVNVNVNINLVVEDANSYDILSVFPVL